MERQDEHAIRKDAGGVLVVLLHILGASRLCGESIARWSLPAKHGVLDISIAIIAATSIPVQVCGAS